MISGAWNRRSTLMGGALAGGLAVLAVMGLGALRFDATVSYGNVLQSFTTLFVAVIVASHLQQQVASDRKEKDIVLRHVDLAIESLDELQESQRAGKVPAINASLKKVSSNCSATEDLCQTLHYEASSSDWVGIRDLIMQIRRLSTASPRDESDTDPTRAGATVVGDVITLTEPRLALLDTRVHQLRMRLLKMEIAINKATRSQ